MWNDSGRSGAYGGEIYVQPFPPTGAKYQLSASGGFDPLWSPDGKELFYLRNLATGVINSINTYTSALTSEYRESSRWIFTLSRVSYLEKPCLYQLRESPWDRIPMTSRRMANTSWSCCPRPKLRETRLHPNKSRSP